MMNAFDQLNDEVLRELKECKKGKLAGQNWTICNGLECRVFYFDPNKDTIEEWRKKYGFYKEGIDRRVIFVGKRPGTNPGVSPNDIVPQPLFCPREDSPDGVVRKLERFRKVRKQYGLENCCLTNIVKCSKLTGINNPDKYEINECSKHLIKEIEIIDPEVVVAVGGFQYDKLRREPFKAFIEDKGRKLHPITSYVFRGSIEELWERWDIKFKKLTEIISRSPKIIPIK